ncbi:hypothetical protein BDBG_07694 [Blastomyces gilchristii SLH14081]|uniref:Uncharacterized protein n=1 Tax=Blastomyces gilchristii (strain SLH14081) TaxID=559298 RepID=A0A179UW47_BLAGS|nr:uncharacterized protein BDBG_07694 [Blastomyces gilchristii SLH14081]OAT12335.1 hypothetical protein BDBG_07694 [Blastomyces gilchristii SLH14081]
MRQPVYSGDQQDDLGNGLSDGLGNPMNQFSNGANSGGEPGRSNIFANNLATFIFLKFNIQSRASIIITASFSVTASTFVILSIIYGSWQLSKGAHRRRIRRRFEFLRHVPPTNIIPLMFSFASILQSSILIGVQSTGLQNVFADGCLASSQITWTAAWIIGYVVLTFTANAVYQSFRSFQSAVTGRRSSLICWVVVTIMLLLTWIPSKIRQRGNDRCLATLLQWTTRWSDIGLALTIGLIVLFIVNGAILSVKLWRTAKLDTQDRIAKSSIVYYLAGTTIIFTLVLPFWIQATFLRGVSNFSLLMGSIALNLFGIVYAFIYLLFCANGRNIMIGPVASTWLKKRSKRHDSTERALIPEINQPIICENRRESYLEKKDFLAGDEDDLEEPRFLKTKNPKPAPFNPISTPHPLVLHSGKPSGYSFFPTKASSRNTRRFVLNSDDSHEDILAPPRPSYARHRRFSSDVSAATVQIGLRLSNIALPAHIQNHNSSTTSLGNVPIQTGTPIRSSPIENRSPGVARSKGSQKELGPLTGSLTAPSVNQNSGYLARVSPLRQNPPGLGISPSLYSRQTLVTRIQEASTSKKDVLPPAPLLIFKGDSYAQNERPPLAQSPSTFPTPSQSTWPRPGRLSLLPDQTFKQPAHWI